MKSLRDNLRQKLVAQEVVEAMARDSFDHVFEAVLKTIWRLFVLLVKLIFRGMGALVRMIRQRGASPMAPSAGDADRDSAAMVDHWNAANAAANAGNLRKALAKADAMIDCGLRCKGYAEARKEEAWGALNFMLAQGFFLRWSVRNELMPVIEEPDPGESGDDCIERCRARDADLLTDLEHAAEHFEEAIKGEIQHPQLTKEDVRGFGSGIWLQIGVNLRIPNPAKGYAAYRRWIELMIDPSGLEGFDCVGRTAKEAGQFKDYEQLTIRLTARYPDSFTLHSGAADAFWSSGNGIRRDGVSAAEFEERTRLLREAAKYAGEAVRLQPRNADIVHLQGRIFSSLDDVASLEATLNRLRPLDRANPLPVEEAQRRLFSDSRTEHLETRLESCRKYLAKRDA